MTELPLQVCFATFGFDAWALIAIYESQFFVSPARLALAGGEAHFAGLLALVAAIMLMLFHICLLIWGLARLARWQTPEFVQGRWGQLVLFLRDGAWTLLYGIVVIGSCWVFAYIAR